MPIVFLMGTRHGGVGYVEGPCSFHRIAGRKWSTGSIRSQNRRVAGRQRLTKTGTVEGFVSPRSSVRSSVAGGEVCRTRRRLSDGAASGGQGAHRHRRSRRPV